MNVQYISDSAGNTTGVFIPINEWNELKDKFKGIEAEVTSNVPEWHVNVVQERLEEYRKTGIAYDWDEAIDDIEKDL